LDATLDLADGVEVLVELAEIPWAKALCQRGRLALHGIENAPRDSRARESLGARAAVAEQPLEHDARVDLGEIRRRLVAPRDRVHVEAVARVALSLLRRVDAELDRRQRG